MSTYENLTQVAEALRDTGAFHPAQEFDTAEQVVVAVASLNKYDKVYAYKESGLTLKEDLSAEFLVEPIADIDEDVFEPEIAQVLDVAGSVIPLWNRKLSESDEEYIQEDKQSRGEDPDD
ncbi:hypothetical protein [Duganella qianjiadongensis]|uniref:Uncharacterized protein n=1 Tax=Duganella qianjiadongensis TaxID=2692176 RepID=A0ABW9VP10_9BURK|nr:hypothetical protein [Duganella qianjiadongensis]MYM41163.1 hypothetical protein [Duganella qianjiadongensis]